MTSTNSITLQVGGSLELVLKQATKKYEVVVTVTYEGFTATAMGNKMAYTLPVDKYITVKVAYVDSHGNPAVVDGEVSWASSDAALVTTQVEASDSFQCKIVPAGRAGSAPVTATVDADMGEGRRAQIALITLSMMRGAVDGTHFTCETYA